MEKNNGKAGCFNLMHAAASHLGSSAVANANRPHRSKAAVKTDFRLDLRLICSSFQRAARKSVKGFRAALRLTANLIIPIYFLCLQAA